MSETHQVRTAGMKHPKQMDAHFETAIVLGGIDLTTGGPHASTDATALLTGTATTAGRNGTAVPHKVSMHIDDQGWLIGTRAGKIQVNNTITGNKVEGPQGEEVFGRLTNAGADGNGNGGTYDVTFFYSSDADGSDQAIDIPDATYDFVVGYNFRMHKIPANAMRNLSRFPDAQDAGGGAGKPVEQVITLAAAIVAAATALPAITNAPRAGTRVYMSVNGDIHQIPSTGLTLAGLVPTWDPTAAGKNFPLELTDEIFYIYNQ